MKHKLVSKATLSESVSKNQKPKTSRAYLGILGKVSHLFPGLKQKIAQNYILPFHIGYVMKYLCLFGTYFSTTQAFSLILYQRKWDAN